MNKFHVTRLEFATNFITVFSEKYCQEVQDLFKELDLVNETIESCAVSGKSWHGKILLAKERQNDIHDNQNWLASLFTNFEHDLLYDGGDDFLFWGCVTRLPRDAVFTSPFIKNITRSISVERCDGFVCYSSHPVLERLVLASEGMLKIPDADDVEPNIALFDKPLFLTDCNNPIYFTKEGYICSVKFVRNYLLTDKKSMLEKLCTNLLCLHCFNLSPYISDAILNYEMTSYMRDLFTERKDDVHTSFDFVYFQEISRRFHKERIALATKVYNIKK